MVPEALAKERMGMHKNDTRFAQRYPSFLLCALACNGVQSGGTTVSIEQNDLPRELGNRTVNACSIEPHYTERTVLLQLFFVLPYTRRRKQDVRGHLLE